MRTIATQIRSVLRRAEALGLVIAALGLLTFSTGPTQAVPLSGVSPAQMAVSQNDLITEVAYRKSSYTKKSAKRRYKKRRYKAKRSYKRYVVGKSSRKWNRKKAYRKAKRSGARYKKRYGKTYRGTAKRKARYKKKRYYKKKRRYAKKARYGKRRSGKRRYASSKKKSYKRKSWRKAKKRKSKKSTRRAYRIAKRLKRRPKIGYASKSKSAQKKVRVAALGKESFGVSPSKKKSLTGGGVRWVASSGCLAGSLRAKVYRVAANFGRVTVSSTCRSRKRNRAVGGARRSQHLTGNAVDFRVHGNWRAAAAYLRSHGGGFKHYGGGLFHMDNGPRRRW